MRRSPSSCSRCRPALAEPALAVRLHPCASPSRPNDDSIRLPRTASPPRPTATPHQVQRPSALAVIGERKQRLKALAVIGEKGAAI
ncbi:hypothetical protein C2845_PM17G04370 [Panicum miliaceum]|uniref:Uncharacterized protein n=1 Tax=Panicum miliaceum TaxID=4540 RepID=A0A3L6Q682_PANMI|nr:hypothetical protein C2845_PM17G04370 [Panicum miliaceum]